ncbi:hypothetical protein D3C84_1210760 [compost metagenome]
MLQLHEADRKKGDDDHAGETNIETPAGETQQLVIPLIRFNDIAHRIQQDRNGEHAIYPHHGTMSMGCG